MSFYTDKTDEEVVAAAEERDIVAVSELARRYRKTQQALKALLASPDSGPRYRHKKRGSTYLLLSEMTRLQCAEPVSEGTELVVYMSFEDPQLWARPSAEFYDGRFEEIES